MRTSRPILMAALCGAALASGALVLPSVAGAAPATPSGGIAVDSSATGLAISLPSLKVASGAALTGASTRGVLDATGAGVLQPAPSGEAQANTAPGGSKSAPRTCGGSLPSFPAPFTKLVTAGIACGSAEAESTSATNGTAAASGEAASLSLGLGSILSQLVKPASPGEKALEGVLGKLPPLPAGGESVGKILQQVEKLAAGDLTARVAAGPSNSATTVTASGWRTTARASGAVVTLIPGGGIGGAPLAKVIVGGASAAASVLRAPSSGGVEHPAASDLPALVTVEVNAPAVGPRTYSLVPGQSMTILKGTPLQSTIAVAAGSVTTAASGAVTASASAVTVMLAEGVGASPATADNGGLDIALANANATAMPDVTAAAHTAPKKAPPPVVASNNVPNATVPHTGLPWAGGVPILAGGALVGGALLGWPRVRRRLRVASGSRSHP